MTKQFAAAISLALVAAACGSGIESDAGTPEGAVLPAADDGGGAGDSGLDPGSPASISGTLDTRAPTPATAPDAGREPDPISTSPDTLVLAATQPTLINTETPSGEGVTPGAPHSGPTLIAVADLAARLGVDESVVIVVGSSVVTWRDGSLGCPQPGMQYTQALVEGMKIELSHDGATYYYHSGGNRPPFLCENPSK